MANKNRNRAFTIVEILVVVSIIAMLAGFLIVALSGSQDAARTTKANVKLKEIGAWMQLWSGDNNNRVLPSQFDYQQEAEFGSSIPFRLDENAPDDNANDSINRGQYQGTWSDILWTENVLHENYGLRDRQVDEPLKLRWKSDSPDNDIFDVHDSFEHPFRSTYVNTRGDAKGLPGYFAANDFFDARSEVDSGIDGNDDGEITSTVDRDYTYAMMNSPARSIYLVDSIAGETISSEPDPWEVIVLTGGAPITQDDVPVGDIDFRYGDECMMLMLDGSIVRLSPWTIRGPDTTGGSVDHSLLGRGYRVHQLTKRQPTQ